MEHPGAIGKHTELLPMNPLQIYNFFLKKTKKWTQKISLNS